MALLGMLAIGAFTLWAAGLELDRRVAAYEAELRARTLMIAMYDDRAP